MQTDSMREQLVTQAILTLQGSLYRLAFSYVHDPDEAMDLVQECAYRALKNRARLRDEAGVKPWLFKILVNLALDQIKRGRREAPMRNCRNNGSWTAMRVWNCGIYYPSWTIKAVRY
mgnify:CR=1 FL=1